MTNKPFQNTDESRRYQRTLDANVRTAKSTSSLISPTDEAGRVAARDQKQMEDFHSYIILLKDILTEDSTDIWDLASKQTAGRSEIYNAGVERTSAFKKTLLHWLSDHDLMAQVRSVGEPTTLPMVWLQCTDKVAEALRSLPEVKSVVEDHGRLGHVR